MGTGCTALAARAPLLRVSLRSAGAVPLGPPVSFSLAAKSAAAGLLLPSAFGDGAPLDRASC